jgi:hypothetical protein
MVKRTKRNRNNSVTFPPILIPGTEKDSDGRAYLEDKQEFGLVRRFTGDYIKKGTPHNAELIRAVDREVWTRLQAMLALRAVSESGDDPDTLKPFLATLKVHRTGRADVVLQHWLPVALLPLVLEEFSDEKLPAAIKVRRDRVMQFLQTKCDSKELPILAQEFLQGIFRKSRSPNPQEEAKQYLGLLWMLEMSSARMLLWWADSFDGRPCARFIPSIYCPDLKTALYVWNAIDGPKVCLGCGELFVPERSNQLYHANGRCGARHRQRRYRDKSNRNSKRKKTGGS